MKLEFVNHASILIEHAGVGLLTDPWYKGPAFHKGWSLLVETPDDKVDALLDRVTHIWVSHEHPDHFSVGFFKSFGDKIRTCSIEILFQKIDDQRVADFLRGETIGLRELPFGQSVPIGQDLRVICVKNEFYDSALSIRSSERHILNVNDCAIRTKAEACDVLKQVGGTCDVLLTQFSYAAWKGGPDNHAWREEAAKEKLNNIRIQADVFDLSIWFHSLVS